MYGKFGSEMRYKHKYRLLVYQMYVRKELWQG
jgi:hypothetical protein